MPPGYYDSLYGQANAATLAAQQAAEKAASGATNKIAPRVVLTPEQRQANIARDLALSQTRGARPSGQDSQFYQPAYQPQYQNYSSPLTAFNVSNYGTNPSMSRSMQDATAQGAGGVDAYYKELQAYGTPNSSIRRVEPGGINFNNLLQDMRRFNISAQDLQSAYGPQSQMNWQTGQPTQSGNALTPELARTLMQRSMTSSGVPTSEFQKFGGYDAVKALYDKSGGDYSGKSTPYPQQQFNPYSNSFGPAGGMPQMQTPFSYQQPAAQAQTPFSYQQSAPQANYGLNYSAPMQLPQYVYDTIRDVDSYQSQPVQAYQSTRPAPVTSSGPSKAIVGRSSQIRGTPNVMAAPVTKAKGGIASLLKKHK